MALKFVRFSLGNSVNLMRCVVFGNGGVRYCHNGSNGTDKTTEFNNEKDTESTDKFEYSDEEDEGIDDESISERILTAALGFVPDYGWSSMAISEGAKVEGFSGMAEGMFPREGGDLVLHFINTCNYELGHYLAENSRTDEENRKNIGQTDYIKNAVKYRLQMITPYIESWPQAMSLMVYPSCTPEALESVANMVDDIWYHANDTSTDINWYLKRTSLAGIYGLTELYMVRDKSVDFEDTWKFLDRRFQDIRTTGNLKHTCSKVGDDLQNLACSTLTLVQNLTGFSKWNR